MKYLILLLTWFLSGSIFAIGNTKENRARKALLEYDYFKAKHLFNSNLRKHPLSSSLGLAIIYSRNDNHFFNIDSSYTYSLKALNAYIHPNKFDLKFIKAIKLPLDSLNHLNMQIMELRDQMAFKNDSIQNNFWNYLHFIEAHPKAKQIIKAKKLYEDRLYTQITSDSTPECYHYFAQNYPQSPYKSKAEDLVFLLGTKNKSLENLLEFTLKYPENPHIDWIQTQIARLKLDEKLSNVTFLPINENGKYGYIDSLGHLRIPCQFDWADYFNEGFAAVEKNNKMGFIDKTGFAVVPFIYDDVLPFHHGTATVELDTKKGRIDLFGNVVTPIIYDELEDYSPTITPNDQNNIEQISPGILLITSDDCWGYYSSILKRFIWQSVKNSNEQ